MRYSVDTSVFELNSNIKFGILIGKNIKNSETMLDDEGRLRKAEKRMGENYRVDQVRELPNVYLYREVMTNAGINPNKFPPSVEAMYKRILKGGALPVINALVDLCNAVSIEQIISLGAHDLNDIHEDLEIRFSKEGDIFLPFGATEYENVDKGELVFTSGNIVQTRKWIWRQSELGKTTIDSKDIFFQLVGFDNDSKAALNKAMEDIENIVIDRFQGTCDKYIVDINNTCIEF
ncbi:B3/B4 domain-containing protein [Sporomusa malonica]|uniref:B3/B4 domain-containing protein (DNA/RNA-binding domain of Phe-tRNA-synthetase) n=1 Tax=Sporomusa malonica TaxID=112901 RepID=A0A1W1YAA5_9FIRM|nr:phenylalanine--tRNA ligase beta subunit-related protein [Sporomusa malonica]SMC33073.1 B3/B4 domain-containing protein (DNA/RNA-binding domain of Phe-tRNA-synthetase) [Sporomusa malonica]